MRPPPVVPLLARSLPRSTPLAAVTYEDHDLLDAVEPVRDEGVVPEPLGGHLPRVRKRAQAVARVLEEVLPCLRQPCDA
eukprot:9496105-Pyramimonas_sp.AAC.1